MKYIVLLVILSLAAINAGPITNDNQSQTDVIKPDLMEMLSKRIHPKVIDAMIKQLDQQGVDYESINAETRQDKIVLLKSMLKRQIDLPKAIEAVLATQYQSENLSKDDIEQRITDKIAQIKNKLSANVGEPEGFKLPEDFKLPGEYDAVKALKAAKRQNAVENSENVQSAEKFLRKKRSYQALEDFKLPKKYGKPEAAKKYQVLESFNVLEGIKYPKKIEAKLAKKLRR